MTSSRNTVTGHCRQTSKSSVRSIGTVDDDHSCDCLEKLNLKVEKEMDRLRGEFRSKEAELMQNVQRKLVNLDGQVQTLSNVF